MKYMNGFCLLGIALIMLLGCNQSKAARKDVAFSEKPVSFRNKKVSWTPISNQIRICTYNIQHLTDGLFDGFNRGPGRARVQAHGAASLIEEINPDILIIQEIENIRILRKLNNGMSQPYAAGYITRFHSRYRRGRKQNIALLTRFPVTQITELEFGYMDVPNKPPRGMLRFVVELDTTHKLLVYGVHLKSNFGEAAVNIARRQAGLKQMRKDATELVDNEPEVQWEIMVAGDMNVDPEGEGFEEDTSLEPVADWIDLWAGTPLPERTTIPTRYGNTNWIYPPAAFDRFIVSPEMKQKPWKVSQPTAIQRGVNTNDVYMRTGTRGVEHYSDHYPVYVDIDRE